MKDRVIPSYSRAPLLFHPNLGSSLRLNLGAKTCPTFYIIPYFPCGAAAGRACGHLSMQLLLLAARARASTPSHSFRALHAAEQPTYPHTT